MAIATRSCCEVAPDTQWDEIRDARERRVLSLQFVIRIGKLRRDRGISVARPTALGNPFVIDASRTRAASLAEYRGWLRTALRDRSNAAARDQFTRIVQRAKQGDVTLLCWCRTVDQSEPACHADIIAERVRAELAKEA